MAMLIVLLGFAVALGTLSWSTYRHRQLLAWDRELEAAFAPGERRELPRHRSL